MGATYAGAKKNKKKRKGKPGELLTRFAPSLLTANAKRKQ